ncbi:hypothetical protein BDW71DRAFT_97469 [Aspergillus fruticulosus]
MSSTAPCSGPAIVARRASPPSGDPLRCPCECHAALLEAGKATLASQLVWAHTDPLHYCARSHIDAIRLLLELGARTDVPDVSNGLHWKVITRICSPIGDWALLRLFF